ncbi:MAG: hypothetical protein ACXVA9_11290 [Bdellovibrionales bacterium]
MIQKRAVILALIFFSSFSIAAEKAEPLIVDAFVGSPVDIKLPAHGEIKVDRHSPRLAGVQLSADGKTLRINPKDVGTDTLVVREIKTGKLIVQYLINVNDQSLLVIQSTVKKALAELDGVSVGLSEP